MKAGASLAVLALLCVALGFVWGRGGLADGDAGSQRSVLATLTGDLELRPDQVRALGKLLADEERDLQSLAEVQRQALADTVQARLQRTEDAMLALLDAGQRERYETLTGADR